MISTRNSFEALLNNPQSQILIKINKYKIIKINKIIIKNNK